MRGPLTAILAATLTAGCAREATPAEQAMVLAREQAPAAIREDGALRLRIDGSNYLLHVHGEHYSVLQSMESSHGISITPAVYIKSALCDAQGAVQGSESLHYFNGHKEQAIDYARGESTHRRRFDSFCTMVPNLMSNSLKDAHGERAFEAVNLSEHPYAG